MQDFVHDYENKKHLDFLYVLRRNVRDALNRPIQFYNIKKSV